MPVRRFDVGSWLDSPLSRRRLDLSQFAGERAVVAEICSRVAADGDAALREYGERFDGWAPRTGETFQVPEGDLAAAANRLPSADRAALEFAAQRIRDFHAKQLQTASSGPPGLKLVTRPVPRIGPAAILTIGIVWVASFAAKLEFPPATRTSTLSWTSSLTSSE